MIVKTETGTTYLLEDGHLTRLKAAHDLRRDGEPIKIIKMGPPTVGQRWALVLDLRQDGIPTLRLTSPVVEILEAA